MKTISKKRIIHVVSKYFLPVMAGIEANILQTYKVLVENGWDVTIHTSKNTLTEKDCLPPEDLIEGLKVVRYPYRWYGYLPRINWQENCLVCLHNFNVFPHFLIMAYSLVLKLLGKKKFALVLTPHGGFNPEWSIFPKFIATAKKIYHYTLGTFLINAVIDKMRAVSEWEKDQIVNKGVYSQKVVTISNGLDDEAFLNDDSKVGPKIKKMVADYGRYLFGDARIYSIKNLETIIRALPLIPSDIKFINIGMVGSNDYLIAMKDLAKQLGVSDRVIFPGIVRGMDKYYLNRHSLMFVHMAKWESFCNVVHQAISQGLVCLVANNTALPYLVKNGVNGYLIDTYDHVSLAQKINYVLDPKNSQEIKSIQKFNFDHGKENSWRSVALKMDKLYQNL